MKRVVAVGVLSFLWVANVVLGQEASKVKPELPKAKIAVIRMDRIMNGGYDYERIRMLATDKATRDTLLKISNEVKAIQKQVMDTEDETKLNELSNGLGLLNRKSNMLRQHLINGGGTRDIQSLVRDFILQNYKDKYNLILQDSGVLDRSLSKNNVEVTDITDDVLQKLRESMDQLTGG
jgi:hypothetical protein